MRRTARLFLFYQPRTSGVARAGENQFHGRRMRDYTSESHENRRLRPPATLVPPPARSAGTRLLSFVRYVRSLHVAG
jgi:hypothetical protein